MKKLTVLIFLLGSLAFAQNFFETEEPQYEEEPTASSSFQSEQTYSEPDQGLDADDDGGPGNPGDVPIDNWIFLLPLAGIALGFYLLKRKPKTV